MLSFRKVRPTMETACMNSAQFFDRLIEYTHLGLLGREEQTKREGPECNTRRRQRFIVRGILPVGAFCVYEEEEEGKSMVTGLNGPRAANSFHGARASLI